MRGRYRSVEKKRGRRGEDGCTRNDARCLATCSRYSPLRSRCISCDLPCAFRIRRTARSPLVRLLRVITSKGEGLCERCAPDRRPLAIALTREEKRARRLATARVRSSQGSSLSMYALVAPRVVSSSVKRSRHYKVSQWRWLGGPRFFLPEPPSLFASRSFRESTVSFLGYVVHS